MAYTLSSFKRKVVSGTRLLCVLNEYRPDLSGTYRVVDDTNCESFTWVGDPPLHKNGVRSWTYWPKASGVVNVSENEITWHLGTGKGHDLLTLRIVN